MRMLVVGAGSTGGYFGGRLAQAGRDVTFLVRPARAAQLAERGLQIVSPHGDFTLRPQLLTVDRLSGSYDAILLTVKAFSLESALVDMTPAVGAKTMILPVLNGMRHVDIIAGRFGRRAVVGCACKIVGSVDDQGRVIQHHSIQEIAYGEMNGEDSPRIEGLDQFMRDAGFDARLSQTIEREMWEKWILLAGLGGINCLMRGTVGEVAQAPRGIELALAVLEEIIAVVRAVGVPPSIEFVAAAKSALTATDSSLTSSMYRDLRRGVRIEADQIIGDLVGRARAADLEVPLLGAIYTHLCVYQQRFEPRG
ncbi:MAG: ketopantoate reductase family protein [Steroidobacteraceae bacterium]